ncbi:hypothetical protein BY996DRAFT_6848799 [Phakopsora pachyrhizi]|nr:hypothetical protein BY996DRAFT_7225414 [Phakopsora pachyrhizi]KAI8458419.1 hypothetical protein BY996DRAFT_6848799 [Phakopsora pachyrhizi]
MDDQDGEDSAQILTVHPFRAEREWSNSAENPFFNIENLVDHNVIPLAIKVIGPQPRTPLTTNQIHQLLQKLNIRSYIVQKQEMTLGWPNEFLVVVSINDAVNLPPKSHPHKGVFGYKELNLCFLWTCAPTVGLEVERQYAMLRLRLHTPMRCFPTGPMRQAVMEGVYLEDPFDTGMVLKPTKVDYEAHKGEDGTVYRTGNMILYIDSNPTDPVFLRFWQNPKA